MRRATKPLLALATVALTVLAVPTVALATQPDPNHKVTICHRTHSGTNPYVIITVDEAAIDSVGASDHQSHNEGNAPNATAIPGSTATTGGSVGTAAEAQALKDAGLWWSDVIPPFYENGDPGSWTPLNWDAAGQALFENECGGFVYPPTEPSGRTITAKGETGPSFAEGGAPVAAITAAAAAALLLAFAGSRAVVRRRARG